MVELNRSPDEIVGAAIEAMRSGEADLPTMLDALPVPIYTTDAEGRVTFYNRACVSFAGRTPELDEDRWCVTWKLYTESGEPLPHRDCPMAVAIREKRPVRGASAVAERPNGTRVAFIPYPTPLLDDDGEVCGAVNLLLQVGECDQARELRAQAERCRRLARGINDPRTLDTLRMMAQDYDLKASALTRSN